MKPFYLILVLALSHITYAGSGSGKVQQILVHSAGGNGSGVAMFKMENNNNKVACSTVDSGSQWAFSLENEYGNAMYALLLSAQAQGKSIVIVGANDCAAWGDRERPSYIYLDDQ